MLNPPDDAGLQAAEGSEQETMPVELESIHQHLLAMGSAWRKSLPAADRLTAYAHALPTQPVVSDSTAITHDLSERGAQAALVGDISPGESSMKARTSSTMYTVNTTPDVRVHGTNGPAGRQGLLAHLHTLMAVAAAVLVVGLLATTFVIFSHRSAPSTGGAAATPTLAPTVTPQPPKSWSTLDSLTTTTSFVSAAPAIAPSDPRIVYDVTTSPQLALRRTADDGVTWQSFPLPVDNAEGLMQLYVSPLNPNVVVLHTDGWISQPSSCESRGLSWTIGASGKPALIPLAALSPASPKSGIDPSCSQFLSTNGGRSWTQTSDFFDATRIISQGAGSSSIFMVQDQRLYAYDGYNSNCPSQALVCPGLVVSVDGGMTWKPAPVPSSGSFCGIAMAPTGTVMFAITTSVCEGQELTFDNTIWRSDDAGAHWAPMSHLQFSNLDDFLVVPNSGAAFPTVYLTTDTQTMNFQNPWPTTSFQMSRDGGKTWSNVPTNGIPAGWSGGDVIAQTSDGSVIALFGPADSGGVNLYAWQPGGSSWQLVAPTPPLTQPVVSPFYYLVTPSPQGGGDTLWAVAIIPQGSQGTGPFTNTVYSLQL
ncbi:MAG: hypothetical protein ACLQUY_05030 [Ktedonobacterales bacterium]